MGGVLFDRQGQAPPSAWGQCGAMRELFWAEDLEPGVSMSGALVY